jgi:hypothetical protein
MMSMSKIFVGVLAGLLLHALVQAAPPPPTTPGQPVAAASVAPAPAPVPAPTTQGREIRLADMGGKPGAMRLTRLDGAAMISIPVARRESLKSAMLHLVATNSICPRALDRNRHDPIDPAPAIRAQAGDAFAVGSQ